jgi:hypothetical protein
MTGENLWGTSGAALIVGYVALCASFWGVLQVVPTDMATEVAGGRGWSLLTVCLLAGLPILVYGATSLGVAARTGAKVQIGTDVDGLLIQAYFTGAGSFLPMTTDFEYEGTPPQKAWQAGICLATLYVLHVVLLVLGIYAENQFLDFAAAMFLLYAFVYAFPIRPLDGHDLWSQSKLTWFLVFLPILGSFLLAFPDDLAQIL